MSPDPSTSPTEEAGTSPATMTSPQGPTVTEPLPTPLPGCPGLVVKAPDARRLGAHRDLRYPLRFIFPARHHPDIDLPRVMERHPRQRHTRLDFPGDGAGIFWTRGPLRILVPA